MAMTCRLCLAKRMLPMISDAEHYIDQSVTLVDLCDSKKAADEDKAKFATNVILNGHMIVTSERMRAFRCCWWRGISNIESTTAILCNCLAALLTTSAYAVSVDNLWALSILS